MPALLLMAAFAAYDWESWDYRCNDYSGEEGTDFKIYAGNSSYRVSSGILVLEVEPLVDVVRFVPEFSGAVFADFERQLVPNGFEFPSTVPLRVSNNYTFFIPFGYSTENDFSITVVANNSAGEPRCSEATWEINDTHLITDSELDLEVDVSFDPDEHRFIFSVINSEAGMIPVSLAVFKDTELQEVSFVQAEGVEGDVTSKKEYLSLDVAQGIYDVIAVAATEDKSFHEVFSLFEFYDFNVTIPEIPPFHPEDSYSVNLRVRNLGYIHDNYDFYVNVSPGWGFTILDSVDLDMGEEAEIPLSYTVPDYQVGTGTIHVEITSKGSNVTQSFDISVEPEKLSTLLITLRDISEVTAYEMNNFTFTAAASGTISPLLYYYVYTEPALMIRKGIGSVTAEVGEITRESVVFQVGGSCAMDGPNTMAFNAGRKVLMIGEAIYQLTSVVDDSIVPVLESLDETVEAEKLKMTSEDSSKLFTNADKLSTTIEKFLDGFEYEEDNEYFRALREDLYLFLVDLEGTLQDVGDRMSETCSSVDEVEMYLYVMDMETLQYQEVPRSLFVEGPKVIEFIGPSELKAVSGTSTYFDYVLKNNAGEGFEIDMTPSSDIVRVSPAYTYLGSGDSKDVEVRVSAPDYFEVSGMQSYIEIKTRTYTLNFPVTVDVGIFEPEIIADSEYAVSPGATQYFNITLRTGGLDDIFTITYSGPTWITVSERAVTKEGEATISIQASPLSSTSGEEYVDISFRPESFPEYSVSDSFTVFVSTEANELLSRLRQDEDLIEEKQEIMSQKEYVEAMRYIDKAETAIMQNDFTDARLNLKRAENIIFSVTDEGGINWGLVLAGVVLVGFGAVFWKFLLPKIRGTPEEKAETIKEEVI